MPVPQLPAKNTLTANLYRALALVWKRKSIARIDLAEELGLNKSTITKVINQLLETGIVKESGGVRQQNGAGRRARDLVIDTSSGAVAGMEFRPDAISTVLMDMAGSFLDRLETVPVKGEGILPLLDRAIADCRLATKRHNMKLAGLGLAIPGVVDSHSGTILHSMALDITTPLAISAIASERWKLDCVVENDANCGSWGELILREQRREQADANFLFALIELRQPRLSTSPGASYLSAGFGFVLSGHVFTGAHQAAGEFRSVFQTSPRIHQFSFTETEFACIAVDPAIRAKAARELARNIALVANSLDLAEVILYWNPASWGPEYLEIFSHELEAIRAYQELGAIHVSLASAPENPIAWGAASRWFEHVFALQARWNEFDNYPRP